MKEEDEKEQRGFKVQDRRRFSSEGDAKADVEEAPAPATPGAEAGATTGAAAKAEAGATEQQNRGPTSAPPELEITFATFLVGLSSEALGALGELPDPATGQPRRDLQAAQQLIDIIGMLRDKTRGNLDQTEQSLIDAVLFDLRMKYVELARQSAR